MVNCYLVIAEGACYVPKNLAIIYRRKKYLDQRKLAKAGAPCLVVPSSYFVCYNIRIDISCPAVQLCDILGPVGACSAALGCGRFTQDYIDALKGLFGFRSRIVVVLVLDLYGIVC